MPNELEQQETTEDQPTTQETPSQPAQSQPNADGGGQQPGTQETVFTQAQVDKLIKERLARSEQATTKALLDKLGVEKLGDIQNALTQLKAVEDSKKTELEKLTETKTKADQRVKELEAKLRLTEQNQLIEREAVKLGFFDVTDALALVDRSVFGDELKADDVKFSLEELLKGKPHLAKSASSESPPPPKPAAPDILGKNGTGTGADSKIPDVSHLLPAVLRSKK